MQENCSMMISKHKERLDKISQKHSILCPKFSVLGFCCRMQSYIRDATSAFCKLLDFVPRAITAPNPVNLQLDSTGNGCNIGPITLG
jgi:hypothetical protein